MKGEKKGVLKNGDSATTHSSLSLFLSDDGKLSLLLLSKWLNLNMRFEILVIVP